MSDYKCIIWDWNGTLFDDVALNIGVVNSLLQERGIDIITSVDYYKNEFSFPIIDFYRKLGFDLEKEDFTLIARQYAFLFNERYPRAEIYPDAEETLRKIKYSGRDQLIISASEQGYLLRQVEYFELEQYFTDILGVSDVLGSSKIERAKKWISQSGIDARQVLFIGDTIHDFDTAKAIGCDCALVSRGHNSREKLLATGCKVYENFDFLKELTEE